jgi:hypothetical protein
LLFFAAFPSAVCRLAYSRSHALGCGVYSQANGAPARTQTAVIEGGYRWQVNGWCYAQPLWK